MVGNEKPTESATREQHPGSRVARVTRDRWFGLGLGLVIVLALVLRAVGLTWGFPHSLNVDEAHVIFLVSQLVQRFQTTGSLDPQASSYGALPLYALALASGLAEQALAWLKSFLDVPFDTAPMLYVGRLLSVLASTATVVLTAMLGWRLFGRGTALLSALLLAITLLPVREAHFATVDSMLVAWMGLALWLGVGIARRGAWRDYVATGVALALAMATKIGAVVLLAPILVAHAAAVWTPPRQLTRHWVRLLTLGVVAVVLWLVLNPYAVLDPAGYFDLDRNDSVRTQSLVVRGDLPVLYTLQFEGTPPYLYVLTNWLPWGMGVPLEIVALVGVGYSAWRLVRHHKTTGPPTAHAAPAWFADAYVLAWLLANVAVAGGAYAKFIRYALPLVPVLCLLAGRLLANLWARAGASRRWAVGALIGAVVVTTLAYTAGYVGIYLQRDTRLTAAAWIREHIPAQATVLVEKDEGIFMHEAGDLYGVDDDDWRIWNPYHVDGTASIRYQAPQVSEAQTQAYLDRLLTTDYIILGSSWAERFQAGASRFPVQAAFYARLFAGDAGYELVETVRVYPQLGPFTWRDDAAELTFRLFDHPAVFIFKKEGAP